MSSKSAMNISDKKRTQIFINIIISCIASSMLVTALTTALPAMIADLGVSVNTGQWLTSGYSLAMGVIMPLTAFLITRIPTKRLFMIGLILSVVGVLLCAVSPSFPIMMAARVLQAAGNAVLTAMSQVIILSIYPVEKRGTAMGWYGLSVSAAPIIAPALAGVIIDMFSWRAIFYIAAVILGAALIWAVATFEDVLETTVKKFDTVSFIMSILAFGGITLAIGNIGVYSITSVHVLPALLIGIVTMILFVFRQLKLETPFLELRVLKEKSYNIAVIGSMLLYLVMMGSSTIIPIYVQSIMGYKATVSGLVVLPGALASAIVSPFAGRIYDKLGMRILFISGAAFLFLSNIGMVFLGAHTHLAVVTILTVVRSMAIGLLLMPLITWGVGNAKPEYTAHGSALLATLRTIAGAVGVAVFVGIMTAVEKMSKASYGTDAAVHGFNMTFLAMSAVSAVMLLIGIFGIKKNKDEAKA